MVGVNGVSGKDFTFQRIQGPNKKNSSIWNVIIVSLSFMYCGKRDCINKLRQKLNVEILHDLSILCCALNKRTAAKPRVSQKLGAASFKKRL